jgi:formylglycine-generating enzyme required for sulfatase activity
VIQVPGYTISKEIGVGGMATVYLAVQTSLEREVALKVMTPALVADPNFSRRFLMEARTLASLSHPNIVAVYDVGVTDQQLHYFSMQHLPGGDFAQRIKAGPPAPAEVARVLAGVACALGFAHLRGFVHRDVSPANILFDASDNPVLTDFGIARAVTRTSRLTNAGASVGTSHYMSPEQARGGNVDARSDLYSLGAVAYEALTGQPPFDGEDGFAIAYAHVFEPVPRLPPPLAAWQPLIDRALAKDPAARFPDSESFIAALEAVGAGAGFSVGLPSVRNTGVHAALPPLDPASAAPTVAVAAPGAGAPADAPEPPARAASRVPLLAVAAIVLGLAGLGAAALMGGEGETPPAAIAPPPAADAPAAPVAAPAPRDAVAAPPQPAAGPLDAATDAADAAAEDPEAARRAVETGVQDPINALLALARADLAAQRLGNPPGRNALERNRLALRLAERVRAGADAARARQGLADTAAAYVELAERSLAAGDAKAFMDYLGRAREIAGSVPEGADVAARVAQRTASLRDEALTAARAATEAWDRAGARAAYERALQFDPASQEAQRGLRAADRIGRAGYVFRDALGDKGRGPEMVVLAGARLAVARGETTLAEFRAFWADGGSAARRDRPSCRDRESFFRSSRTRSFDKPDIAQGDDHPVVCVTAADAEAFAEWLSKRSGKRYRLPTATEWLALDGDAPDPAACRANLADASFNARWRDSDALPCDDGFAATAPARRFDASAGGVYDIAGNVREWVSDCAPGCRERVAMGSAWHSTADAADPRQREEFGADVAANTVGFRVVREID